jgi:hypothetical protein
MNEKGTFPQWVVSLLEHTVSLSLKCVCHGFRLKAETFHTQSSIICKNVEELIFTQSKKGEDCMSFKHMYKTTQNNLY